MRPDAGLAGRGRRSRSRSRTRAIRPANVLRDRPDADSLFYLSFNANKRSLTLNLKKPRAKEVFRALLKTADVLLENFGPGRHRAPRLRLPACSREINPRLVFASIKGFGSYGPYRDYKSYEPIAQAMGGAMSVTGVGRTARRPTCGPRSAIPAPACTA